MAGGEATPRAFNSRGFNRQALFDGLGRRQGCVRMHWSTGVQRTDWGPGRPGGAAAVAAEWRQRQPHGLLPCKPTCGDACFHLSLPAFCVGKVRLGLSALLLTQHGVAHDDPASRRCSPAKRPGGWAGHGAAGGIIGAAMHPVQLRRCKVSFGAAGCTNKLSPMPLAIRTGVRSRHVPKGRQTRCLLAATAALLQQHRMAARRGWCLCWHACGACSS